MPELTVVKSWPLPQFDPTPDEARTLAEIRTRESNGDYSARNPKPGSTAAGAYQFIGPTWQLATKNTGAPVYSSAAEAPQAIQDANALHMLRQYGPNSTTTWAASGPYKQPRNQGGAVTTAQAPAGQPAAGDVLSRIATGDVSPDELAQYLQPQQAAPAAVPETPKTAPAAPLTVVKSWAVPPTPPPPSALDEAKRLGSIAAGASGLTAAKDTLAGGAKAAMDFLTGNPVNPQDVQQFKSGAGAILGGIAGEPERMRQELIKSGDAMLHGDINEAANHLWYAVPIAGAAGAGMAEYLKRGDIKGALAHAAGSLAPFAAEPAISGTKAAIEAAPEAATRVAEATRRTAQATGAGVKAAAPDVAMGTAKVGVAYGTSHLPIPGPVQYGLGVPTAAAGVRQIVSGLKKGAAAARASFAETAAVPAAAAAPAVEAPLQLGPGPVIPPAPPDASYVRGVPAQYAQPEPIPPSRQLGPGPIITPPPPDPSFVRAVPAEYPFVESPMVRAAQQAGDFTPEEQARAAAILENVEPQAAPAPAAVPKPAAAELAAQLEASMRAETLTDYLVRNKIPNSMVENFGGQEWKMVADQAGVQPPTQENIQTIRSNLSQYEAAATQPSEVGKMAPAEAKADFEQRIATRTKRKGPAVATEPAPAAAPTAEAPQVPESWQGAQPPPPGPPAPTASEVRVEAFAKHLAQGEIPTDTLAGLPSQPKALLQLEELGRSLGIEGRPAPGEVQQIVDRVRQLRGEGAATTTEPGPVRHESWEPDYIEKQNAKLREREKQAWDEMAVEKVKDAREQGRQYGEWSAESGRSQTPAEYSADLEESFRQFTHPRQLTSHWDKYSPERQAEIRAAFTEAYNSAKPMPPEAPQTLRTLMEGFAEGKPPAQEPPAAAPRKRRSK